jgi:hypothetical protein
VALLAAYLQIAEHGDRISSSLIEEKIMRSEVSVTFKDHPPVQIELHEVQPMPNEAARRWLDEQFTQMECEPLRPTGKLLTADKVVVVAEAAGPTKFADAQWAQEFARAVTAALGRPLVNIDVTTLSISY